MSFFGFCHVGRGGRWLFRRGSGRRRGAGPGSRRARAWCCSARSMRRSRSSGSPHGSASARRPGACIRGSVSGRRTRSTTDLPGCPRSGSRRAELVEGLRGGGSVSDVISFGGWQRQKARAIAKRVRSVIVSSHSSRISATMKSRPRPRRSRRRCESPPSLRAHGNQGDRSPGGRSPRRHQASAECRGRSSRP